MIKEDANSLLKRGFKSESAESTLELASLFAKGLPDDAYVALSGDLGTGKTMFAKGLAAGLGVRVSVKSPSFNICSIYDADGGRKFVHIDAYRLSSADAFEDLLIEEIAPSPRIVCIEWPEMVADALPSDSVRIVFDILADGSHFIKFAD